jgi:hypothetical protein
MNKQTNEKKYIEGMNTWHKMQGKAMQCNGWMTWMNERHGMNFYELRRQYIKWHEWHKLQWTELKANHMKWIDT